MSNRRVLFYVLLSKLPVYLCYFYKFIWEDVYSRMHSTCNLYPLPQEVKLATSSQERDQ